MKITFILGVFVTTNLEYACAQGSNLLTLPALTDVSKAPWRDSIYLLPEFQKGKITYTKGFELEHPLDLNYNIYYEKMYYINSAGDTLNVQNTREIQFVQIGDKYFFHDYRKGYYEIVLKLPVALAVRNKFVLESGQYNSGNEVSVTKLFTEVRGVVTDYDRFYSRGFTYFLIDKNNTLHRVTRASVLKLFPLNRNAILKYLDVNKVDFESREDLTRLISFCNQSL